MRIIVALLLLSQLVRGDFLEIREVVKGGEGGKSMKLEPTGEKLALSDDLIVSEQHLANVFAGKIGIESTNGGAERPIFGVSMVLSPDGEQRMLAATKNGKPGVLRLAVVLDGKLVSASVVNAVPLGKHFQIHAKTEEEANRIAAALREKMPKKE